jgi:predicted DNA-binding antitoxin AbrB/MazE fold protein
MTTIIRAVYEGGVLRPTEPLALPEGETVEVIITQPKTSVSQLRDPSPAENEYAQRIRSAKSLSEMFDVMATAPVSPEDEIDIVKEINESRRLTGFRMPDSGTSGENQR